MSISGGDVVATVSDTVIGEELNISTTESVVVQADDTEIIAQLETLNDCVGLILSFVFAFVVWYVIRNVYNLFSMFFSF